MILRLVHQQHSEDTMSFNSKLNSTSISQSEYHQRFLNLDEKSCSTIDCHNQPSKLPLPDSLPFFKYSKSAESRNDHNPIMISSNRTHSHRASSITVPCDFFRDRSSAHGGHSLFHEAHASPARSISLDSSYYNLPKISMDSASDSPNRNENSRAHSYSSTTPPPSLPPLSETLSNIFTDSPRESSISCDAHGTDSLPTPNSTGYSRAISPSITGAPRASDSPHEQQTLPPILLHEKTPQQHVSNSHSPIPACGNSLQPSESDYPTDEDKKVFSFVALPGINGKKRPRRKFDEIERLYGCSWQGCNKSYGTLNHLNAHVMMQKHGSKRLPNEFKELRKNWKKQRDDGN